MLGHKALAKLDRKKFREEYGVFLVEGKKGVSDALDAGADVEELVMTDRFVHEQREFCQLPKVRAFFDSHNVLSLSDGPFAQLADTTTPQGVLAVVKMPKVSLAQLLTGKTLAILDDVRDPGNVGTIIRTADWFGVDGLIFAGGADPYQPKVVRASMGSLFHLPLFVSEDITADLQDVKAAGFNIIVTRPELADAPSTPMPTNEKRCLIFGNESRGTSAELDELADQAFSLPRFGKAESLNVAVSFGLVMYELKRA